MSELLSRVGLPLFVQAVMLFYDDIFLLIMIVTMCFGIKKDREHHFVKKIAVPYTEELLVFFIANFFYNLADIGIIYFMNSISAQAYYGVRFSTMVYYFVGAFLTMFVLEMVRRQIVKGPQDKVVNGILRFTQFLQVLLLVLLVITPFYECLYYFDDHNIYRRSWGYDIWYGVTTASFILMGILLLVFFKRTDSFFRQILLVGTVLPTVGFLIDHETEFEVDINTLVVTLAALLTFFLYENYKTYFTVDYAIELEDAETKLMLSQIQPHFMHNTLTALIYYSDKDPVKTRDYLMHFSNYLRANVSSLANEGLIPIESEINHVKEYLHLEQLRFGDRISVEYDIADVHFSLPPLTVQPIVENAIRHGIRKSDKGHGTVRIKTYEKGDFHVVEVSDDGKGFDTSVIDLMDKSHVGIRNVRTRLDIECGGELEIESHPAHGTRCMIRIPANKMGGSRTEKI